MIVVLSSHIHLFLYYHILALSISYWPFVIVILQSFSNITVTIVNRKALSFKAKSPMKLFALIFNLRRYSFLAIVFSELSHVHAMGK